MRKLIAVNASPHRDGGCSKLLAAVCEGAEAVGYAIVRYDLNDMNVRGCQGCGTCKGEGIDCVLEDDLKPYWAQLHTVDALAIAAPNHCSLVNGTFLTYMARHYCLLTPDCRLHPGIQLIGCFSQGREDLEIYRDHYDMILRDFENRDMVRHAMLVFSPRLAEDRQRAILEQARRAGSTLEH